MNTTLFKAYGGIMGNLWAETLLRTKQKWALDPYFNIFLIAAFNFLKFIYKMEHNIQDITVAIYVWVIAVWYCCLASQTIAK